MPRNTEILTELEQLSMVVARISRELPYEAPAGYFSEFPETMLALLNQNVPETAPSPDWGKGPAMSVPEGYFEGFAARMMDKIKDISSPSGEEIQSPLLSRIGKNMPYQVPEGYFDTLEPIVEEPGLSPLMAGLKGMTAYEAPEGYFERLPEILSARIGSLKEKSPARVISISRQKKVWWQYSAAAVVAAFVFTIGWLRLHTPSGKQGVNNMDVAQSLAKVSDQDIQSYLDNQDNHMAQIQQDDVTGNSTASLEFSDNDIKSFLGDVSDNDLSQYMEEHGDLKDYPTN